MDTKRVIIPLVLFLLSIGLLCGAPGWATASKVDIKGVTTYYPDRCYNGYTLYEGKHSTNLIDMNGYIVHTWPKFGGAPIQPLLKNGHYVQLSRIAVGMIERELAEYDWDGNIVWSYKASGILHHDYYRTATGNILTLYKEPVPEEYKANITDEERRNAAVKSDCVIEVTPHGKVVWEWHAYEHLDIDQYCPLCKAGDWLHMNTVQELPETALGKRDARFKAGNILINPRNLNTIYIIDKDSGEVVWRWGTNVLRHPHHTTMLESGNIILFDNGIHGQPSGFSRVLEVDPSTGEIVWEYSEGTSFFSRICSGVQRLPNGNTLICSSRNPPRIFEVTPEKEMVWEFISETGSYRAFRIPYDHCPQSAALPRPKEEAVIPGVPDLPEYTITDEAPVPPDAVVPSDINGDGLVDQLDLARLVTGYGSEIGWQKYEASADLNGDEVVDYLDLAVLGANYGRKGEYTD